MDTIAAVATAPGLGAVGVVKLAGPGVRTAIAQLGWSLTPRKASLCQVSNDQGVIDSGLALFFPGPNSYTGDDTLEFQGHGGPVVLNRVLQRFLQLGARLALPGEFSQRAFINDKLDLAQAEAVADLISAASEEAAIRAMQSLQGEFSKQINALYERIVRLRVYVEAAIDFPEEEVDFLADGQIAQSLTGIETDLTELVKSARSGQKFNDGVKIVLVGQPNTGKSSLLNRLSGEDSAIVTATAGTTRDVLKERINLGGLPAEVLDTAGLRDTVDPIEAEGVRRARQAIDHADLTVFLTASGTSQAQIDHDIATLLPGHQPDLIVLNKADLNAPLPVNNSIAISAKTGLGVQQLIDTIKTLLQVDIGEARFLARSRHLDALARCQHHLAQGSALLAGLSAGELLAEDLRAAHDALGDITGKMSADDLLGEIFSSFCIGK